MLKRVFDIVVAGLGLAVLAPLFLVVAIAVKLDSRGPVFFRQERLGLDGRRFRIYKFRSMVADAHRRGGRLTVGGDVRITRVGRFLRRHKLDELPQLINVLQGDMSMVGPRPEVPEYATLFPGEFARILTVKPGITHEATLLFRNEEQMLADADDPAAHYIDTVMPIKMRLYVDGLDHTGVMDDIRTIVDTVLAVGRTDATTVLPLARPEIAEILHVPVAPRVAPVRPAAPVLVETAPRARAARETVA